jgi:Alkylmercury lyase
MALRSVIYRRIADTGTAPSRHELVQLAGDGVDAQLRRLHDAHMIVLDDRAHRRGEIRMALPFAVEPTNFRVTADPGAWWANCAWDSLAIAAAIGRDVHIASTWDDTGERLDLRVVDGQIDGPDGFIHFPIPARQWWDDIVFT